MANLKTTYMGIEVDSPLLIAASSISSYIDRIKLAEQAGAGLLVIRSHFLKSRSNWRPNVLKNRSQSVRKAFQKRCHITLKLNMEMPTSISCGSRRPAPRSSYP